MKANLAGKYEYDNENNIKVRPFIKWVGGKSQLLGQLNEHYPLELHHGIIDTYIEPFVGGGAVFFELIQNYNIKKAVIIDNNKALINTYITVKNSVDSLISSGLIP
ncbi:MAG TPA: N-6 DNA methylase, partial [Clostridiales bacterium]|nr:N-6 DNA methylase [Clostridiales bacterium]